LEWMCTTMSSQELLEVYASFTEVRDTAPDLPRLGAYRLTISP